jgi:hypothetical protein
MPATCLPLIKPGPAGMAIIQSKRYSIAKLTRILPFLGKNFISVH